MIPGLLAQLLAMLIAARIGGRAARFVGQPGVIGEMTAGVLLGQFGFSWLAPTEALNALGQIGLILFLFLVGLRMNVHNLHKDSRLIVATSLISILIPFTFGALLGIAIHPWLGNGTPVVGFSLFIGAAMSITAFPVLAGILRELRLDTTRLGTIAIGCAAIDDLAAWLILAAILTFHGASAGGKPLLLVVALLTLYLCGIWFGLRPLASRWKPEALTKVLLAALGCSMVTEWIGLHAFFGAVSAGFAMPKRRDFTDAIVSKIEPLTVELMLPLFFTLTGYRARINLLQGWTVWAFCFAIICTAVMGKWASGMIAARWMGLAWRDSCALGILMNTRGLVELIALNIGLDRQIISPQVFSMMVIMAIATTLMTMPLLKLFYNTPRISA